MDISKANKPIHIRCPYCKEDLQYNGASIKSQKEGLINRLESINYKLKQPISYEKKKNLIKARKETLFRLKLLSEDIHMLSQLSEIEVLKNFKQLTKEIISEDDYKRLIIEAERKYLEENTFNYYDLAIQKYTNYENI